MNTVLLQKSTKVVAWLMAASMAIAFAAPKAAAFQQLPRSLVYEFVSQSGTISSDGLAHQVTANAGDTVSMSLTVKNRSQNAAGKVWYGKSALLVEPDPYVNAHAIGVGTARPYDNQPSWVDASSFVINGNRFTYYDGVAVNSGDSITLTWNVKVSASAANGTYDLYTGLVREWDEWGSQWKNGKVIGTPDIFWRFIIGGGASAQTGALTVSSSPSTPAASQVATGGNANFTRFTLTAASGTTVKISSIYVTRDGLSTDSEVENIKLLDASLVQRGNTAGGFNASHQAQIFFSPELAVTGSMDFYVRAGFVTTATSTHTARLGIASSGDIVSNATSVSGAPVYGNYMSVVDVDLGTVTMDEDGSVTDTTPDVGDTDVVVNTFKLTAGTTEDINIEQITTNKAGSASASDTKNIELWDVTHNASLGTVTGWSADDKAVFPVSIHLTQGQVIRLRIQLDIVSGSGLTVNSDLVDGSDVLVFAKGALYGYYITPTCVATTNWTLDSGTGGTNNLGQGDKNQTVAAGSLVVSKSASTAPTGNIAQANDQILGTWDFEARGESVRISALSIDLAGTAADTDAESIANFKAAKLFDENGAIVAGPLDATADGATALDRELDFTQTFVVPVGVHKYTLKVNVLTGAADNETVYAAITAAGDITAKTIRTNTDVVATGPAATLNTMTVKGAALVSTVLATPVARSIVPGIQDFTWMTGKYDASASGEDILITAQQFSLVTGTDADVDHLINMTVWADLDGNGTYETQLSNPANNADHSLAADLDKTINYDKHTLTVPKGSFINVAFIASLSAAAPVLAGATFTISFDGDASDVTASGKDTGTAITTAPTGTGPVITVTANGTLTITLDSSTPLAQLLVGNASKVLVTTWRFTANNVENIRVDDISVEDVSTGRDDTTKVHLYANRDNTGALVTPYEIASGAMTATDNVLYMNPNTSLRPVVPANGYMLIYAYADTAAVDGTYVANGDTVELNIDDVSADVNVTGISSGQSFDPAGTDGRDGGAHKLYKSIPTVTVSPLSPSGNLVVGSLQNVAIFRIAADAADDITFYNDASQSGTLSVQFLPFVTDLTGAAISTELWNYTDNVKVASPSDATWAGTPFTTQSQIDYTFDDAQLTIPAGTYKDVAVKLTTTQWEDTGDSITVALDDTAADFAWAINGVGYYSTGNISFRGDIYAHTLVKAG